MSNSKNKAKTAVIQHNKSVVRQGLIYLAGEIMLRVGIRRGVQNTLRAFQCWQVCRRVVLHPTSTSSSWRLKFETTIPLVSNSLRMRTNNSSSVLGDCPLSLSLSLSPWITELQKPSAPPRQILISASDEQQWLAKQCRRTNECRKIRWWWLFSRERPQLPWNRYVMQAKWYSIYNEMS